MERARRAPLLVALAWWAGCGWHISDEEHLARVDGDLDGHAAAVDCDDADGEVWEVQRWHLDADRDGVGGAESVESCNRPNGHVLEAGDCDDADPDYVEPSVWYADLDRDGFGAGPAVTDCGPPRDHVAIDGDCDDANPAIFPGGYEICNLLDDDCDGVADDDAAPTTWWVDADHDGFGDDASAEVTCDPPVDGVLVGGDCDDADPDVRPDALEVCNGGIDDDCDALADDDDPSTVDRPPWYPDADEDGYGDGLAGFELSCEPPPEKVGVAGDCDDARADRHPGADEVCDGVDNDCDNLGDDADPDLIGPTYYADADGDGFGDPNAPVVACALPVGFSEDATDCDDAHGDVNPARPREVVGASDLECADTLDNDCDGLVDASDDDCDDTDGDGTVDGIDAIWALDCAGTGQRTCVCGQADLLLPPDWADDDAIHVVRGESCLLGLCSPAPTDEAKLSDTDPLDLDGAWCWDLAGEPADTYVFRWISARSAADPTQPVDTADCGDWKKIDLALACGVIGDPYCTTTGGFVAHVDACDSGNAVRALSVTWNGSSL